MSLQKKLTMNLPVPLDQKQKAEIGERMAEVELSINSKEERKKAIAADYGEQIKNLEAEMYGLAKQFQNNAVTVEVECRVDYNIPEKGQKTITRLDTNEFVKQYDMSPEEIKAIEEPDMFDQQSKNYPLDIFSAYGIEVDMIFQPDEYEENIFIVDSAAVLTEHEISFDDIDDESLTKIIGSLVLRLNQTLEIHKNIIASGGHFFCAESAESEDMAWYFFRNLNPVVKEEEQTVPVIEFNPETMDKEEIEHSYSGDVLVNDKIRSHFEISDVMYVTTLLCGDGQGGTKSVSAFKLIPEEEYTGETHSYKDNVPGEPITYKGQLITYRKKKYVLSDKIEIVFPVESEEQNELKKYELPEKE